MARDLVVQERIIADLQGHAFTLTSVAEPDPMAKDSQRVFFRQMMGAVAQLDKSDIVRSCAARGRASARGKAAANAGSPVASMNAKTPFQKRMEELRASKMGFDRIPTQPNAEGLKPRMGERRHGLVVNRILTGKGRDTRAEQHA